MTAAGTAGLGNTVSNARLRLHVQNAMAAQLRSLTTPNDDDVPAAYEEWLGWLRAAAREPGAAHADIAMKLALVAREMAADGLQEDGTGAAMFGLVLSALLDLVLASPGAQAAASGGVATGEALASVDPPPGPAAH